MTANPEVLIVGAGAAGLACGKRLAECGVSFRILEAADRTGGQLHSELFFPTAAPETRRALDYDALDLQPFARAALVRFNGRFHRIADSRFEPLAAIKSLANPIGTLRDKLRLMRLSGELHIENSTEALALDWLRWRGRFTPAMIDRFFRPLAGLLFNDTSLAISSREYRVALRMFVEGPIAVPALGMIAIANQLAERLPIGSLRLNAKVERLGHREVFVGDEAIRARAVVVATEGASAAHLLGEDVAAPRESATLFYSVNSAAIAEPIILLNGEGQGPANHVVSLGQSMIAAGVVGSSADEGELDRQVRVQLAEWFGAAADWKLLRIARHSHALLDRPVRVRPGLYACAGNTLEHAFTSGFRAAQAAMEDLHANRT